MTDSYVSAADLSFIEKEAFQVINAIVSDFKNTVDRLFNDNQNIIFPDIQIQLPDKSAIPMSEHAILMLFAPIKEEAPENPVKIFLSFKADKSSSKTSVSAQFVGKVIEEAKQVINLPAGGKGVSTAQDIKEKDVDIGRGKYGFVIKFSYLPYASGMEPEKTPQLNTAPSTQRDAITQAPELANTYHVSGKVIDSQYLNLLFLRDGKENEVFEKLSVFISGVSTGPAQAEVDEANGILQEDRVGTQIENIANTIEPKKTRIELPFQSACEENKYIVASLDLQKNKDEVILVITESVKESNGATSSQEGDLKGTILNTGSGQGELKSSPMAGLPYFPC